MNKAIITSTIVICALYTYSMVSKQHPLASLWTMKFALIYINSFFVLACYWSLQPLTRTSNQIDLLLLAMVGAFYHVMGPQLRNQGHDVFIGCHYTFGAFFPIMYPTIFVSIAARHLRHHLSMLTGRAAS